MGNTSSFRYPSADGVHQIYAAQWLPQGQPKGVVQIVHGISEYVERYDRFAQFLAGEGYLVCGEDHLGHGNTVAQEGTYGWFAQEDGWDLVLEDTHALTLRMQAEHPHLPYFLFGHSMGSFLTRNYLIRWPGQVSGAILSGTGQEPAAAIAFGQRAAALLKKAGKGKIVSPFLISLSLGTYNRAFAPARTRVDWISRDTQVQDDYLADPFCTFQPSVAMFHDMMVGLGRIGKPANLARMDKQTPIFLLSGDRDPVGQMGKGVEKVYSLFRAAGCKDVSLHLYREGRHEMLNEINYEQVHKDVLAWLEGHLPPETQRGGLEDV